jgi:hypothetical protein
MKQLTHEDLLRSNMAYNQGRIRSCVPKVRFADYDDALRMGVKRNLELPVEKRLAPYKCPFCKNWHLGGYRTRAYLSKYEMKITMEDIT